MSESVSGGAGIRNIALVGPSLGGKTTLLESMLFAAGAIDRKGSVKEGNTVGDHAPEARERAMSTEVSAAHATFEGVRLNILDCPGSIELQAEARGALMGADAAVVVYEPALERTVTLAPIFRFLEEHRIPHIVFVNKMDRTAVTMRDLVPAMQEVSAAPLLMAQVPVREGEEVVGYVDLLTQEAHAYRPDAASQAMAMPDGVREREREARTVMLEALADFDDDLMMKLLEDETPAVEEARASLRRAFAGGDVAPVLIGAAERENGVRRLLQEIVAWTPPPQTRADRHALEGAPAAQVLKTFNTQHGGKLSLVRVWRGTLKDGENVNGERIGGIYRMMGGGLEKLAAAAPGDIVALARLDKARTGDTLLAGGAPPGDDARYPRAAPLPRLHGLAIHAARRNDEVKMATALQRIHEEDPSIEPEQDADLRQLVLWGQGDMHLQIAFAKLGQRYGVEVASSRPRVPYREAIRKPTTRHGRFKRQTGGSGMFGDVQINIRPLPRGTGFEFANSVTGGHIPRQYIPAVEAGVKEYLERGPLGFPVVDVAVEVFDGKYHDVDSNEMAFKLAARVAMTEGMPECAPVLLEPIVKVTIETPAGATSRVQQLVTGRRGQLLGFEAREGWKGWDSVTAHMPQGEIRDLIGELRSLTQGVASFTTAFERLQELTGREAERIVEERREELEAA